MPQYASSQTNKVLKMPLVGKQNSRHSSGKHTAYHTTALANFALPINLFRISFE